MADLELSRYKYLAFDVDGTLVIGGKHPEGMVEMLNRLSQVVPWGLISGSSHLALQRKIVDALLVSQIKFDEYSSGGSVRLIHGVGQPIYDSSHASDVYIPNEDALKVRQLVQDAARSPEFWGDTWLDTNDFLARYRQWALKNREGNIPAELATWKVGLSVPGIIDPHSALRVELRHDPIGKRMVGISIKSIPRVLDGVNSKFVDRLTSKLQNALQGEYQVLPAGFASIDVNMGNGHKGRAIENIVNRLGILPHQILYFGDEFEDGNDKIIKDLGVTCVDVSSGGPDMTLSYLKKVLIKYE
jgi:hydroxymethylpyrimidine pyrophosphatase-like HAD family hydrolase